ncbi:MAG TPA: hypothetical protein VIL36_21150 [Acidimicrobiales bacterium]
MGPFLVFEDVPTSRPVPEGWLVKPFGDWDGHAAALAYDPRRFQVMLAVGVRWADIDRRQGRHVDTTRALTAAGWAPFSVDHANGRSLWVRDLRAVGLGNPRPTEAVGRAGRQPIGLER